MDFLTLNPADLYVGVGNTITVAFAGRARDFHVSGQNATHVEVVRYIDGERTFTWFAKQSILAVNGQRVVVSPAIARKDAS